MMNAIGKKTLNETISGFCLFHKRPGISSFKSLGIFKKKFKGNKTGFAGTLDPAASGLLIVGIGQATRLLNFFEHMPKEYTVDVMAGKTSDTYDDMGKILEQENFIYPLKKEVEAALDKFTGKQMQMPPIYSAIKIKGKRACDRVRNGESVTLQPREINIYSLKLLHWQKEKWTLAVKCSKGTYIRSLAYDLGNFLKCGALASNIIRTAIGDFKLEDSNKSEDLDKKLKILPPEVALSLLPKIILKESVCKNFINGEKVPEESLNVNVSKLIGDIQYQAHHENLGLLGLGTYHQGFLSPDKILVSSQIFKNHQEHILL